MLRALLVVVCLWSGATRAETIVPLTVGGHVIRVAVDDRYVRSSEKQPSMFAVSSAAMPPTNRLVEQFVTAADAKRMLLGQPIADDYLQVQSLRDAEGTDITAADWASVRPTMVRQLGGMDMDKLAKPMQSGMDKRMSESSGADVAMTFGKLGKPTIYGNQPESVRFVMLLPITATINGQARQVQLECAGAITVLNKRLVYIYNYRTLRPEDKNMLAVRAALDHFVDRAEALNAAVAAKSTR